MDVLLSTSHHKDFQIFFTIHFETFFTIHLSLVKKNHEQVMILTKIRR